MAKYLSTSSHPSLNTPLTAEELLSWLRLLRSRRVGVTTFYRLLTEHGSARAALDALPEVARAAGVDGYAPCPAADAEAEIDAGRRAGARLIAFGAPGDPAALADIPDPPPLLWVMGDIAHLARPMVALVGGHATRGPWGYGWRASWLPICPRPGSSSCRALPAGLTPRRTRPR